MSEYVTFEFRWHGNPVPKPRMTRRDVWLSPPRPCVARSWAFKDALVLAAKEAGYRPALHLIRELHFTAFIAMPKSWSAAKCQELALMPHTIRPDISNILKGVEDALTERDETIHTVDMHKVWAARDEPAGLYVELICVER